MGFFTQSKRLEFDVEPARIPQMVDAVERLVLYTGGHVQAKTESSLEFAIPPFIFAGRTKPLARLSGGDVSFIERASNAVEMNYTVSTSRTNKVAGFVIIVMIFLVALLAWHEGQTENILVVIAVLALGPLFAFTLVHQSVTRFEREVRDACLLGAHYGDTSPNGA
ncbi:MAG: hypothetical protein ACR2OJ_00420 [Hyphomicrobiales bacterium]